ncbi:hypothetical protein EFN92_03800 [Lactococcus lactis]|uniref:helix-turn-helix domain-containing protein n=1 Tax=Lactococcus lactis TaxID=1358 RepID=UPI0021A9527D|nr:helix-turn-helix domain-containing protein [Lactococcus lactis]MCT3091802.1 hypothetical protein [Lactococcus lactis]
MEQKIYILLEKKNRILCSIIDLLVLNKDFTDIALIGRYLKLNCRSVQRYVNDLSNIVTLCNQDKNYKIILEYHKFKGVRLDLSGHSLDDLKHYMIKNDLTINIFLDLIYSRMSTVQSYSQKHFLTENLVRKSIKKISVFTKDFDVKMNSKEPFFEGEEENIRLLFYVFLWNLYKNSPWPFKYINELKVYQSINLFSKEADVLLSPIHKKQFSYFIAINNLRFYKRYHIEKKVEWANYVKIEDVNIESHLKNVSQKCININEDELFFFLLVIQTKSKFYISESLKERILNYHKKKGSDIYNLTNLCIKTFTDMFFDVPLESKEFVFVYLFSTNLYCRIFKNIGLDIEGYSLMPDSKYHRKLLEKISLFLNYLYKITRDPMFLNKELLIPKYYMIISYCKNTIEYEEPIDISLSSDLPILIRAQLKKDIYAKFSTSFNINFLDSLECRRAPDIILTNFQKLYSCQNTCPIAYPLTEYNIKMIETSISKVVESRSHKI